MSEVVNLTPHAITIRVHGGDITFPPSGKIARIKEKNVAPTRSQIFGFPVAGKTAFEAVLDLPEPVEGTIFIVSGMVAAQVSRPDVFSPATGPEDGAIRNDKGQIVAVTKFKETV